MSLFSGKKVEMAQDGGFRASCVMSMSCFPEPKMEMVSLLMVNARLRRAHNSEQTDQKRQKRRNFGSEQKGASRPGTSVTAFLAITEVPGVDVSF